MDAPANRLAFLREAYAVSPGTPEFEEMARTHYHEDILYLPIKTYTEVDQVHGRAAVLAWLEEYTTYWVDFGLELRTVETLGDLTLVCIHAHGRGRASGAELSGELFQLVDFRDGLICRIEDHLTRDAALRAAGVSA
jgi:ketosteroid isomerase-like protein